jgi:putative SbcD/Mre11-related phosphoesterase
VTQPFVFLVQSQLAPDYRAGLMTGTIELSDGICLDARRAVWLPEQRTLAVADLHLGYAWAQREQGQMLPVHAADNTTDRLLALQSDYSPTAVVLLGDIVHRAIRVPQLKGELGDLLSRWPASVRLTWVAGNHDKSIERLLGELGASITLHRHVRSGSHLLLHGDDSGRDLREVPQSGGRMIIGHEHPAIRLGDGVTTALKCACFLVGPAVIVLPAFSQWAAGSDIRRGFMSRVASQATFHHAVAIMGDRLLSVPLDGTTKATG